MAASLLRLTLVAGLTALLAACASGGAGGRAAIPVVRDPAPIVAGTMKPYQIRGRWYRPAEDPDYEAVGLASWYGAQFNGRPTASGERFDMNALTGAHPTLPLPSLVEVTHVASGRSAVVRINDRGPFAHGRIIDLSRGSAEAIGLLAQGVGEVRVRYLGPAPRSGGGQILTASRDGAARDRGQRTGRVEPGREDPSRFWVQAGSFADQTAARLAAEGLTDAGRGGPILGERATVRRATVDGQARYRVVIGPWDDANSAEQARQAAVARGVRDALLISDG